MIGEDMDAVLNSEIEIMLKDPLGDVVDIIGYNEYFGWYYASWLGAQLPVDQGTTRNTMFKIMNDIRFRNVFGKPIIISETGAGAKKGYVSDKGPGMIWSEEYQAKVYQHQVDMLSRNDQVKGMSPWLLKDFRSGLRNLNGIQEIYNRKGLVSRKGREEKSLLCIARFLRAESRGVKRREAAADRAAGGGDYSSLSCLPLPHCLQAVRGKPGRWCA